MAARLAAAAMSDEELDTLERASKPIAGNRTSRAAPPIIRPAATRISISGLPGAVTISACFACYVKICTASCGSIVSAAAPRLAAHDRPTRSIRKFWPHCGVAMRTRRKKPCAGIFACRGSNTEARLKAGGSPRRMPPHEPAYDTAQRPSWRDETRPWHRAPPMRFFARVIEDLGFEVAYVTGAGIANMQLGVPDIGLTTLTEIADTVAAISDVVTLPVLVDADTGFGNAVNMRRTIRMLERAGAAGMQIEDQVFPEEVRPLYGQGSHTACGHGAEDQGRRGCPPRSRFPDRCTHGRACG